jgi:uncharacterized protein (TIGR02231 family)
MRILPVILALLPSFGFAEDIVLAGKVTDVILYPEGATVTRNISFQAAAGVHTLVITEIPADGYGDNMRVTVSSATMGIVTERRNFVPPRDDVVNGELEAARAIVDAIEGDIRKMHDQIKAVRLKTEAVAALVPENLDYVYLAISVSSQEAMEGVVHISSLKWDAAWAPSYDMRLSTQAPATLVIDRAARVWQGTGENWQGVNLQLSTLRPTEQLKPSRVYTQRRRIKKPAPPAPAPGVRSRVEAPVIEPMMIVEGAAPVTIELNGLSATYGYPSAIDIASGADTLRIVLGRLETSATLYAEAAAGYDETGFLMAEITNDMGEFILPSSESAFFLDGRFVGNQEIEELIALGAEATLAFGPIEGLRLSSRVVDRNEGDTGFVSRVNEIVKLAKIGIEKLTDRAWDVRLLDRVPYSEQEDLVITWRGKPAPSEVNVDGQRGILQWDFTLAAKERKDITLSFHSPCRVRSPLSTAEATNGKVIRFSSDTTTACFSRAVRRSVSSSMSLIRS